MYNLPKKKRGKRKEKLTSVDLLTRPGGIGPVGETDEREPFRPAGVAILGEEDTRDPAKPLEDLAQVVLLCELGHVGHAQGGEVVPLVSAAHAFPSP